MSKKAGQESGGRYSAVLFDIDGVLCNSEEPLRMAAVFCGCNSPKWGVQVTVETLCLPWEWEKCCYLLPVAFKNHMV
ncbi:hypothetical protein SLEP1_g5053 [Rubroshorea leprosula]|uniref:Uncharacterized protein n=1 Tax=Rubroshorea leprosula TaxID=152421 RepID=A0AAV5HZK0_9ROSI|nr:hypothetical protein SLEP1_g5053 [Rubroshorea leprosula]